MTADQVFEVIRAAILAMLMTLGWSLMTNVSSRHLWHCLLITALGFSVRQTMKILDYNIISATFVASAVTSFLAVFLARRFMITPKAVLVPALLCMMPGVTAYKAMISFVELGYYGYNRALFEQMLNYATNAIFVTSALVFGLSLPTALFYRKRPIV